MTQIKTWEYNELIQFNEISEDVVQHQSISIRLFLLNKKQLIMNLKPDLRDARKYP